MPETENRTLEDIEFHFSDNSKKLTDRKIAKVFADESKPVNNGNNVCETAKSGIEHENGTNEPKNNTQNDCDNRGFVKDI